MILEPDRVLLDRTLIAKFEMVVVVIGIAIVVMHKILAEKMVGQRVFRLLLVRHCSCLLLSARWRSTPAAMLWHVQFRCVKVGWVEPLGETQQRRISYLGLTKCSTQPAAQRGKFFM